MYVELRMRSHPIVGPHEARHVHAEELVLVGLDAVHAVHAVRIHGVRVHELRAGATAAGRRVHVRHVLHVR
jgi:hypothetical protein